MRRYNGIIAIIIVVCVFALLRGSAPRHYRHSGEWGSTTRMDSRESRPAQDAGTRYESSAPESPASTNGAESDNTAPPSDVNPPDTGGGGVFAGDLPDPKLTPGAARSTDLSAILDTELETEHARPDVDIRKSVCEEYGVPWSMHSQYEIDHLIPIECGGANDPSNLWPEHRRGEWGALRKDKLENYLGELMRERQISPAEAQADFTGDWRVAAQKYGL